MTSNLDQLISVKHNAYASRCGRDMLLADHEVSGAHAIRDAIRNP